MDVALFSPSAIFADDDDDSSVEEETKENQENFVERRHNFPGMELLIREFSFHQLNANLLWPGTFQFAEWLVQHRSWVEGRRCIELGSGTGALAIFLSKSFHLDITTSDYSDQEIEENIAHNCRVNGITPVLPHIKRHLVGGSSIRGPLSSMMIVSGTCHWFLLLILDRDSWGDNFPTADPYWDLVIASDILLYVKQYSNLINTLSFLLKSYKPKDDNAGPLTENDQNGDMGLPIPAFLMSWRRRIGKEDESFFFTGCEIAGLEIKHLGSRVYCIKPKDQISRNDS